VRNNLVIVFIILLTYFSFMNNSQACRLMHDGINIDYEWKPNTPSKIE
jgi:hypothetical protein